MSSHIIKKFQHSTKSNLTYHPPNHKQNKHYKFPKDRNNIQTKQVRTNAIEEIESRYHECSEEGEGDDQVNQIKEQTKK